MWQMNPCLYSYGLPLVPDLCTTGVGSSAILLRRLLGGSVEPRLGAMPDCEETEEAAGGAGFGVEDVEGTTCGICGGTVGPVIPPPLPTVLKYMYWYIMREHDTSIVTV